MRLSLLTCGVALLAGCGDDGPQRYEVTGTVTYQGQAVPRGYIVFTPDAAAGNQGPGASAEIENGTFKTKASGGVIGGPHTASISGFDGNAYQDGPVTIPNGKPLFTDIQVKVELPKSATTHDFQLPVAGPT